MDKQYLAINGALFFWLLALIAWSVDASALARLAAACALIAFLLHSQRNKINAMFIKKNKTEPQISEAATPPAINPEPEAVASKKHETTVIASGVHFVGNIVASGHVYIHGQVTGNIEAKEAMLGECDVIVADGYSGNIMLKSIEGTGKLLSIKLKEMLMHSTGTKLAALLLKGQLGDFKKMLDANEVGGTALLGISKPVVKAHGSASEVGICNAVRQAMEVARSGIIDDIAQNIDKMRIEQKAE